MQNHKRPSKYKQISIKQWLQ